MQLLGGTNVDGQETTEAKTPQAPRKRKVQRTFPASTLQESLEFVQAIFNMGGSQPVKRLTLFDHLGKSPESGPSRQMIINAGKYGLTKGGVSADNIELTPEGLRCVDDQILPREKLRAKISVGINNVEPFRVLYERFVGNKIPAKAVLSDAASEIGVEKEHAGEAVDTFLVNLRFVGLLKTLSGAERVISIDMALDDLPSSARQGLVAEAIPRANSLITSETAQYESTCFYIAPIGDIGSEFRKHSDLLLGSFVEPALEEFGLKVFRADAIDKPGIITRQIIEYIIRSRLVIADLSFHNPNVFYELALRHAIKLPIVQIVRAQDKIPFDVAQMRTISIDTSDVYTLVPKIESYRAEIANQVRRALEEGHIVDTPISSYFPTMSISF